MQSKKKLPSYVTLKSEFLFSRQIYITPFNELQRFPQVSSSNFDIISMVVVVVVVV